MVDENEEQPFNLTINNEYARKFNYNKKRQELERLKSIYGDKPEDVINVDDTCSSSSSSIDESNNAELDLNDPDFINVLTMIKTGDKHIYDKGAVFFEENKSLNSENVTPEAITKKRKRPLFLKDYQYEQAMSHQSEIDNNEPLDNNIVENDHHESIDSHYIGTGESIVEKELKQSIAAITDEVTNKVATNLDSEDDFFFPSKNPKYSQMINEESDVNNLKKRLENEKIDEKIINLIKGNEVTLKSLSQLSTENGTNKVLIDNSDDDDDENTKLVPIQNDSCSARKKDERRIKKRNEKKLKKKQEKMKMLEEIKILKILQRDELNIKLNKIKEIAGLTDKDNKNVDLSKIMDDDFDENRYNDIMKNLFDDEYYNDENDLNEKEIKPLSCVDDKTIDSNVIDQFFDDDPNSHPLRMTKQMKKRLRKERKKLKTQNKLQKLLVKQNDDDSILPSGSFAYRETFANNFGLTAEEILLCDDKELNQWCSLKKCIRYKDDDEEVADYAIYAKKSKQKTKKAKILKSIQQSVIDEASPTANK